MDKEVGNLHLTGSIWCIRILICFTAMSISTSLAANSQLQIPPNVTCACPNEVLTFTCTNVGSGATIWGGSAFQCSTGEIILRHNAFSGNTPPSGDCNGIIGESVGVQDNNCYTSLLRVPVTAELNNKTVRCVYNSEIMTLINETQISVVTGPYQQAPTGVRITDVNSRGLNVTWMPLDSNCPSIDYLINFPSATCHVTTETTAICSDLQLPSECTLSIQSGVCEHIGTASDQVRVILRVPDQPAVNITPIYSANTYALTGLRATINQEVSFNITNGISGSITSYNISYSQTNEKFSRNSTCVEGSCEYMINVPTTACSLSTGILNITLSASNILGQGPPSHPMTIGCENQFVQVEYNLTTSAIVCKFLDEMDTKVKSCAVMYGQCGEVLAYTTQGNSTMEAPNRISLRVDPGSLDCYVVTASSGLATVIVNGRRVTTSVTGNISIVVAATIVPIVIIAAILITIVMIVLVVVIKLRRYKGDPHRPLVADHVEMAPIQPSETEKERIIAQLDLRPEEKNKFKIFDVEYDYQFREFVKEKLSREFKRGCYFYEFEHAFESISGDKRLLFMDNENNLFSSGLDTKELKKHHLVGEKVSRPNYKPFKVFVQSVGLGARHLKGGTKIVYQKQDHSWQKEQLRVIVSDHFKKTIIPSEITVKAFRDKNKLPPNRCNVFLELKNVTVKKDKDLIDAILIDPADKNAELYSGPFARDTALDIVKQRSDQGKWKVFVLCRLNENMELRAGTEVLHQNPECRSREFDDLTVDEDNVRLSTFIQKKGYKFINGHAFYEFSGKEDLQCYKEVVYAYSEQEKVFESSTDLFYAIQGAPDFELSPPKVTIKGVKGVFLQSTSQGSRCLKKGTRLLYKKAQQSSLYESFKFW